MKTEKFTILIVLFLLIGCASKTESQNQKDRDIEQAENLVLNFYDWYLQSIKSGESQEYQPEFIESTSGNTTLDFDLYFENLRRQKFSKSFIESVRLKHQNCLKNLDTIPFETYSSFENLDDYERIECDFSNVYEWFWSMEYPDGIQIQHLEKSDDDAIIGSLKLYTSKQESSERFIWNNTIKFSIIQTLGEWEITKIENNFK